MAKKDNNKVKETIKDTKKKDVIDRYTSFFNTISNKKILADLKTGLKNESVIYKKYPKDRVMRLLDAPQTNEKQIRELSNYLYTISTNYQRLCNYYADLLLYNYYISPINLDIVTTNPIDFKKDYCSVVNLCEKYNLKEEAEKALKNAIKEGIFCGICYETKDSFYIKKFNPDFALLTAIEDGCFKFSIDLEYFKSREDILSNYPDDVIRAYNIYKGNTSIKSRRVKNKNNKINNKNRYYEPIDGVCLKVDPTDESYSIPLLTGLIASVYDIEEYGIIQKTKARNDIYKAIVMQMEVDENGVPKMDEGTATRYFNQADGNIADNVGLILTPFKTNEISFSSNSSSDRNAVIDAENDFWYKAGVSPLMFGSQKGTSQGSLLTSAKPDEAISYSLLLQFQRFMNMRLKKSKLKFEYKIKFLNQSIFNQDEEANRHKNGATYGVSGAKLKYAASLGQTPSDVMNLTYLEDEILKVGTEMFVRPLISSNTLSNGQVDTVETNPETGGRPTNDSKGEGLTDEGEKSREKK